jgi:hypothetical protein
MRIIEMVKGAIGLTVIEVLVGIAIFAVGCFTLTQVMFGVMSSEAATKKTVVATSLAEERMSQIVAAIQLGDINEESFPDEDYGQIGGGAVEYAAYRRTVAIADAAGAPGRGVMKTVEVEVEWREGGRRRNVSLRSSVPAAADAFDR